jgi:hypothetical protein
MSMLSRDEAILVGRRIQDLKERGKSVSVETEADRILWGLWLHEGVELIKAKFPESYVAAEAAKLLDKRDGQSHVDQTRDHLRALLEAAERYAQFDAQMGVSEDFRRAVDIAIKDVFFESWYFKGLLATFSILLAVLLGGTIYSTVQVVGVVRSADEAQQSIRSHRAEFDLDLDKARREINSKTSNIDDVVRTAVLNNVDGVKQKLEQAQTEAQGYIDGAKKRLDSELQGAVSSANTILLSDQKRISDGWAGLDQKIGQQFTVANQRLDGQLTLVLGNLDTQSKAALKSVDDARGEAVKSLSASKLVEELQRAVSSANTSLQSDQKRISDGWAGLDQKIGQQFTDGSKRLDGQLTLALGNLDAQSKAALKSLDEARGEAVKGLNAPAVEVENSKRKAVSSIETDQAEARNKIATFRSEVEGQRDEFLRQVDDGKKKIAATIDSMPEEIKALSAAVAAVNHGLQAYHVQIAAIMDRMAAEKGGRISFVIDVLGWSFWVAIGSLALSVIVPLVIWSLVARWARRNFQPKIQKVP